MSTGRGDLLLAQELDEMSRDLAAAGYEGAHAEELQRENVGPYELRHRLTLSPSDKDSLWYEFGMASDKDTFAIDDDDNMVPVAS